MPMQLAKSADYLASKWMWNKRTVLCFLDTLQNVGYITLQKSRLITITTIKKGIIPALQNAPQSTPENALQSTLQNALQNALPYDNIDNIDKEDNKEETKVSPAEQEFRQVEESLRNEIAELKKQLEDAKKDKPQRAKPIPKTLVSKAQAIFMEHYKALGLSDTDYYWGAKDGQNMKLLLNKIKYSRESRGKTTDDDSIINALNSFLMCIKDKWILSHYEVSVINSKYNEIVASAKISTANEDDILKSAYKNIGLNKEAEIYGLNTYEFSMLTDQQRDVWRKKNKARMLEYLRNNGQ